jgi:hypothetical protein
MSYIDRLEEIATKDCDVLRRKDKEYGGSWLKRGGIGAFMMLARKWDRLEQSVQATGPVPKYDIIEMALADEREEGLLDDIGDLRRYLLLVEAEIRERMDKNLPLGQRPCLHDFDLPEGTCLDGPTAFAEDADADGPHPGGHWPYER